MNYSRLFKIWKMGLYIPLKEKENFIFIESKIKTLKKFNLPKYDKYYFYMDKNGFFILEQDFKNDILWVRYENFWETLEFDYNLDFHDIQDLITIFAKTKIKSEIGKPYYQRMYQYAEAETLYRKINNL